MRHRKKGRKLNRNFKGRRALYRGLLTALVEHEKIETTLVKAKTVKPLIERLVTVAKKGDLPARRKLLRVFYSKEAVEKMIKEVGPRFKNRQGGYTRLVKLGPRASDKSEMARLEFLPKEKEKKRGVRKEVRLPKEKSQKKSKERKV